MRYQTNFTEWESRDHEVQRLADLWREVAKVYPAVKTVLEQFDRKVYTKRLDKALKEILKDGEYIYTEKRIKWIEINYMSQGSRDYVCICQVPIDSLIDGKRIDKDVFIKSLTEKRTEHLKRAAQLEDAMTKAKDIKEQIEIYIDKINRLKEQIGPYEAREIYGLNYYIRKY